jgi:arylsulfatase A-like enzyme
MTPPAPETLLRTCRRGLPGVVLAAWLACTGCNDEPPSRWVDLAQGFEPGTTLRDAVENFERGAGAATGTGLEELGMGISLERAIAPSDWQPGDGEGRWTLEIPAGAFRYASAFLRLAIEGHPTERVPELGDLAVDRYAVQGTQLTLCLAPDSTAPAATLHGRLENGGSFDGQWRVRAGTFFGPGIPVWSNGAEELERALPPDSQLQFRFAFVSEQRASPVRYRVRLDGQIVLERELAGPDAARARRDSVVLPRGGARRARLTFEVEAAPGLAVFYDPRLAPAEIGAPGTRPWGDARPDLVLFIADTFRADNLALYGGDPDWTPRLARFAEEAVRFRTARSTAAWTLPALSSLFTGLYPGQHGATDQDLVLAPEHETLAERLAAAGYRTGAITDDSFFSPVFGLEQGFEWFSWHDHTEWDLDRTLDEALTFFAEDDGRPLFLVVHTYRTHAPYRVGPEEDGSEYQGLEKHGYEMVGTPSPAPDAARAVLLGFRDDFRRLYREGARDLDAGFGRFLDALEERRFFEHGYLGFTSDHGEALGENGDMGHGGHLWEVKLRIPLLLRGPALEPRDVDWSASLVDLAPTLAELARVAPAPGWTGTSLVGLDHERPAFAFQLAPTGRQVAFLERQHKVITTPDEDALTAGTCEEAFDLAADPDEASNLASSARWPADMTRRLAPALIALLQPRNAAQRADVDEELRNALRELGYAGENEAPPRQE